MSGSDDKAAGSGEGPRWLPGDPAGRTMVDRIVRVDHAGEYGAVRIYAGQLAVLGRRHPAGAEIRRMAEQEERHLETFETLIAERRVRPTALTPLWHLAGFGLGAATALLGSRGAMACTVAVEETIDQHYAAQAKALEGLPEEAALKAVVEEFRADELEHRDTALAHGAEDAPAYPVLSAAVKAASRVAIWLSERI
ncbi:MAG: demethoxyubiquinone hydroxylase family protein [Rhodospirillales bacterium]|nr:MAG: demethoxyubiquinone hydroxylase family protein [Rhodospirillales bacterium]